VLPAPSASNVAEAQKRPRQAHQAVTIEVKPYTEEL